MVHKINVQSDVLQYILLHSIASEILCLIYKEIFIRFKKSKLENSHKKYMLQEFIN